MSKYTLDEFTALMCKGTKFYGKDRSYYFCIEGDMGTCRGNDGRIITVFESDWMINRLFEWSEDNFILDFTSVIKGELDNLLNE